METTQLLGNSFPEIQVITQSTGISPIAYSGQSLKIWPNPVENQAQLSFEADGELAQIQIYSMTGHLVENHQRERFPKGSQQIQLQLGHLVKGSYQLVLLKTKSRETIKFVVI